MRYGHGVFSGQMPGGFLIARVVMEYSPFFPSMDCKVKCSFGGRWKRTRPTVYGPHQPGLPHRRHFGYDSSIRSKDVPRARKERRKGHLQFFGPKSRPGNFLWEATVHWVQAIAKYRRSGSSVKKKRELGK